MFIMITSTKKPLCLEESYLGLCEENQGENATASRIKMEEAG